MVFSQKPAYGRENGFGTPDTTVPVTLCSDSEGSKVPDVEVGRIELPSKYGYQNYIYECCFVFCPRTIQHTIYKTNKTTICLVVVSFDIKTQHWWYLSLLYHRNNQAKEDLTIPAILRGECKLNPGPKPRRMLEQKRMDLPLHLLLLKLRLHVKVWAFFFWAPLMLDYQEIVHSRARQRKILQPYQGRVKNFSKL